MKLVDLDSKKPYILDSKYTVDYIIRCKNCIYWKQHDTLPWMTCDLYKWQTKSNDFCSYGERGNDEHT